MGAATDLPATSDLRSVSSEEYLEYTCSLIATMINSLEVLVRIDITFDIKVESFHEDRRN